MKSSKKILLIYHPKKVQVNQGKQKLKISARSFLTFPFLVLVHMNTAMEATDTAMEATGTAMEATDTVMVVMDTDTAMLNPN